MVAPSCRSVKLEGGAGGGETAGTAQSQGQETTHEGHQHYRVRAASGAGPTLQRRRRRPTPWRPEAATDPAAAAGFEAISEQVAAALSAKAEGKPVSADNWMVAAANPHAVAAGAEVLRAGGSAADAMVAVQTVLGLVEPQSSGLGGGAFLVWYDAASGELTTLDGRETAPLAATPTLFQDENGEPLGFFDAVVGGRSVGTPGTPDAAAGGAPPLGPQPMARPVRAGHRPWPRVALPSRRAFPA